MGALKVERQQARAWVPLAHDPNEFEGRESLAVSWVLAKAQEAREEPVLHVPAYAHDYTARSDAIGAFARAGVVSTHKSRRGRGPGLVLDATIDLLDDASRGPATALCATEGFLFPLAGWAMQSKATDLTTGKVTLDTRTEEQREAIERLERVGYNGWNAEPGKRAAKYRMAELAESGLTWAVFIGSLAAITPRRADVKALTRLLPPAWVEERRLAQEALWRGLP